MTSHLCSGNLGQDELVDVWRKVEKRRLKRLAIDLKQRLNKRAVAIKHGATEASTMAFQAAPVSTPPGSTALEVTVVDLQPLTMTFEVADIG
jgi:hypothetical protein